MPALAGAAQRLGLRPADGGPRRPARRLPSLEPQPTRAERLAGAARRLGFAAVAAAATIGSYLAVQRIGWDAVASAVLASSPLWVLLAVALMGISMVLRAASWHAILQAALPHTRVRLADAFQGTAIGVLMSATLPARLGEPSRALIVARRLGRPRELLPTVLGTLVSQTVLNLVALAILGGTIVQHDRAVRREPAGARAVRGCAVRRPARRAGGARARAPGQALAVAARAGLARRAARRAAPRALRAWTCSASRGSARWRRGRSWRPGRCSGSPASCCWPRSASTTAVPASAPPPRCCSRSTSPPRCR